MFHIHFTAMSENVSTGYHRRQMSMHTPFIYGFRFIQKLFGGNLRNANMQSYPKK